MELPTFQLELEKTDESDVPEESNSSGSETEEDEDDSGMDESVEGQSESESENSESDSGIAKDFCTHRKVCPSIAKCVIFESRLVEDKKRLKKKLRDIRAGSKELMEKRRALSIIKRTICVESKIRELERILEWVYKARGKMSTPVKSNLEIECQTLKGSKVVEATTSPVNER